MTETLLKDRVEEMMTALAKLGKDERGYTRLAFSDADMEVRSYLIGEMERAGLTVREDAFGNVFARTRGNNALPAVLIGSHADSVPQGGNYDGIVGIVGAIAVAEKIASEKLPRPVEVVLFMAEESSRFGVANLGSKAMAGMLPEDAASFYKDSDGKTLGEVMAERGFVAENAPYKKRVRAFLELHIEQGGILESQLSPLGIVTGIAAPHRYRLTIGGRADHSGTTPMNLRRDALTGAADMLLRIEELAQANARKGVVATVGQLDVYPNAMNVVPGKVTMSIDLRGTDEDNINSLCIAILENVDAIAQKRNLAVQLETLTEEEPALLDEGLVALGEYCAGEIGERTMRMASGAGHDALYMTRIAPVGMIFVPSKNGISHNPAEYTEMADIVRGTNLLYHMVKRLAEE
ncbi:MAG: Zn-dependent hydrolase [Selenomonadales bacterium]|jgi:hydantoinase/carbamoylase family amidase|nr:Zn-dependent hydrolase [Selenomonadales bacterium]MBQ5636482.1 Zn-dependent hydrolase [Selenomonadales bacterium]MBQ5745597.1 Zn-dependent hydrolase [Selenomonadales bacterium]